MFFSKKYFTIWVGLLFILGKFSASTIPDHIYPITADQLPKFRDKLAEKGGEPIIFYSNSCLQELENLFKVVATIQAAVDEEGFLWFKFYALNIDESTGPDIPTQQSKPELWINYEKYPSKFKTQPLMNWILGTNYIKPWKLDTEEEEIQYRRAPQQKIDPSPSVETDL